MNIDVEQIVREYIDKSLHMSLATTVGDKPWVCEVHFVYDDNLNLFFRSLTTRRHSQEIAANSNVAGNIVQQHTLDQYPHAIYFEGKAELFSNPDDWQALVPLFRNRLSMNESILEDAAKDDGHKFYKIIVDNWYAFGKFGGDKGLKHKLEWNGGKK
jgi:uncharacterized protein YhbP (UPF0306 family)